MACGCLDKIVLHTNSGDFFIVRKSANTVLIENTTFRLHLGQDADC